VRVHLWFSESVSCYLVVAFRARLVRFAMQPVGASVAPGVGFCSEFTSKNMLGQVQKKGGVCGRRPHLELVIR